MSLLDSFTKKKLLTTANAQVSRARSNEGKTAEQMFKSAYRDFAEVLVGDSLRADALYNWGFALLHHAKSETGKKAADLYQEAIAKFSFCLLLNPDYLGAAINGGVAYMDLARLKAVAVDDELYELAKEFFVKANTIQAGSAAYNLACIHGLRNEGDACLKTLEIAKNKGFLPDAEEILADVDLDAVKNQAWFIEFVAALETVAKSEETITEAVAEESVNPDNTSTSETVENQVTDVDEVNKDTETSQSD